MSASPWPYLRQARGTESLGVTEASLKVLFGTPLLIARLNDKQLNSQLEERILQRRDSHPGFTRHNRGGWQSDRGFLSWGGEAAARLVREVADLADSVTRDVRPGVDRQNWIIQAWANVNEAGAVNLPHGHTGTSGCFWSVVYYVRCMPDAGGEIVFYDPRGSVVSMHARHLFFKSAGPEREAKIAPAPGMLLLFPSWLFHAVNPYSGGEPRISVAMNLSVPAARATNDVFIDAIRSR
jgi:uncharacterized protein (TIGR02466 family)